MEVTNFLEQFNEVDQKQASLFLKEIMEYAESDLICYRVPMSEGLRKLQDKSGMIYFLFIMISLRLIICNIFITHSKVRKV